MMSTELSIITPDRSVTVNQSNLSVANKQSNLSADNNQAGLSEDNHQSTGPGQISAPQPLTEVAGVAKEQTEAITEESEAPPSALPTEQLEVMAQKLQEFVGSLNKGLEFSVDNESGRDVIKVIDRASGDTIRQYPSEEVLDLVASLSDAAGTFVNLKA